MPPRLTRKQLLWTGIVLAVVGLVARLYLVTLLFALGGNDALNIAVVNWVQAVLGQVALQVGLALIAAMIVMKALERSHLVSATPPETATPDDAGTVDVAPTASPALAWTFWIGLALIVVGLVLQQSLLAWQYDLMGAVDVAGGIARDILWLLGAPLEAVAVPLGTLLVAGSLIARTLQAEQRIRA